MFRPEHTTTAAGSTDDPVSGVPDRVLSGQRADAGPVHCPKRVRGAGTADRVVHRHIRIQLPPGFDGGDVHRARNFNVAVTPTPRISRTSFVAFGDSITFGTVRDPIAATLYRPEMGFFSLGEPHSYPYKLNTLLTNHYKAQTLTINNEGWPGELASTVWTPDSRPIGEVRIHDVLDARDPQVLLLMEGTNDLFFSVGRASDNGIPDIIDALEGMIDEAQLRSIQVFLATIAPQRVATNPNRSRVAVVIPALNQEIRALAVRRNVVLVDIYAALVNNMNLYIGNDHLHPTEAGYQKIAETFFESIKQRLDITPASALSRRR